MPITPTYPGVYIEEIPSGVRTITGVATSITAFIGRALRGPVNEPVRIQSFAAFDRIFGGLWVKSTMSYAVQHFFLNGGADAVIVRVVHSGDIVDTKNATKAPVDLIVASGGNLQLEAANEGDWGNKVRVRVDHETRDLEAGEAADSLFNLSVKDMGTGNVENFRNISTDPEHRSFVTQVLEQESSLIRVLEGSVVLSERPDISPVPPSPDIDPFGGDPPLYCREMTGGSDGSTLVDNDIVGAESDKTGLYTLENTDLFNLMCIPSLTRDTDIGTSTLTTALAYCKKRRAFLIADPPSSWDETASAVSGGTGFMRGENAAVYFPKVKMSDPLQENRLVEFGPCGAVAGIFARTDAQRGIWKAPAGQDATLTGARGLSCTLTDGENGQLNPLGVNCLRTFPVVGTVLWGARTREGADQLASEWKYIPVRRMALFIEESLYRGTQWVVFEPNDEPLWAQIRLNVGAFMHNLFRQGAFQGATPREAYLVKCDKETTTQNDINQGIVNILVGFAPLKPAEFVFIKIQQLAGQIET